MHKVANIFSTFLVVRIVGQFQEKFISISDLDEIKNVYAVGFDVGLVKLFEGDGWVVSAYSFAVDDVLLCLNAHVTESTDEGL